MLFRNILREIKNKSNLSDDHQSGNSNQKTLSLSVRALRQIDRLQLNASRYLPGSSIGQRPSLRRLPSVDFLDHRLYIPGDDIRFIDWKASARSEHTFVKQGNLPREITVYILLDCSASMLWKSDQKSITMFQLALTLAHLSLAHSETLFIIPVGSEKILPLGPLHGKGQIPTIINYLKQIPLQGEIDLEERLLYFRRTIARRGGLVYVLSDLLYLNSLDPILGRFKAPSWDVVFFHILHPDEISPKFSGNFEFEDIETGKSVNYDINDKAKETYAKHLNDWMLRLSQECVDHNHFYTMIPSDWDLDTQIIPHLKNKNLVVPA